MITNVGAHDIVEGGDAGETAFGEALLEDLHALEQMLSAGTIECDTTRIGVEQEMFLVDRARRPAPIAELVHKQLADPAFATDIGKFNMEANLPPRLFDGHCLQGLEHDLLQVVRRASAAAYAHGAEVLLTGILPSVRISDLTLDNLTDLLAIANSIAP